MPACFLICSVRETLVKQVQGNIVRYYPSVCKETLPSQPATAKLTVPGALSPREAFAYRTSALFTPAPPSPTSDLKSRGTAGAHAALLPTALPPGRLGPSKSTATPVRGSQGAGAQAPQWAQRNRMGPPGPAGHFRLQEHRLSFCHYSTVTGQPQSYSDRTVY